jgi:hypothetical protein
MNATIRGIFANRKEFNKFKNNNGYFELHHIFPSCLCNKEQKLDKNNLIALTTKEHFLVHLLLSKIFIDKKHTRQMLKSLGAFAMDKMGNRILNSRQFSLVRKAKIDAQTGVPKTKEQKEKQSASMLGKVPWNKGQKQSETHRLNNSISHTGFKYGPSTQEKKDQISKALTGKMKTREHCDNLRKSHIGLPSHTEKSISIDDTIYRSIKFATHALNLSDVTIRKRLKSEKYKDWFYC